MKKILTFSILLIIAGISLLSLNTATRAFSDKVGVNINESDIIIENFHFSGFGIDHHYLWQVSMQSNDALDELINETGFERGNTDKSGCLFLFEDQSPLWWDSYILNNGSFELYIWTGGEHENLCLYKSNAESTAYIEWHDN